MTLRTFLVRLLLALVLVGATLGCSGAEPTVRTEPSKDSPPRFPGADKGKK